MSTDAIVATLHWIAQGAALYGMIALPAAVVLLVANVVIYLRRRIG